MTLNLVQGCRRLRRLGGQSLPLVFLAVLAASLCLLGAAQGADQLDPAFGSAGVATAPLPPEPAQQGASIVDLAAAPDGTTVGALGGFTKAGYFGAVRLTPRGEPDPAFGQNGFTAPLPLGPEGFSREAQAEAVAVQGDGRIVVAGYAQDGWPYVDLFTPLLARYLPDGGLDPGFGAGGTVVARTPSKWEETVLHGLDLAPDGRILVAAERVHDIPRRAGIVLAFESDGSPDKSFGRGGRVVFTQRARRAYTAMHDLEVLSDGKVLVAGYHAYRLFLARLRPNGRPDRSFGGGDGRVEVDVRNTGTCCPPAALAVQADGRIVVAAQGGFFRRARVYLVRFRPRGGLDRSFGNSGIAAPYRPWRLFRAHDVAVQAGGGIVTVGQSAKTKQNPVAGAYSVFRNLPDGSPDESFGTHGLKMAPFGDLGYAGAALAQPDGGVLTGGSFATVDPSTERHVTTLLLARFLGSASGN